MHKDADENKQDMTLLDIFLFPAELSQFRGSISGIIGSFSSEEHSALRDPWLIKAH